MIRKDFPALREHYFEERLPNGLLVRVIPRPGFAKRFAFLATDFGSIDMRFSFEGKDYTVPAGVAHYLEHKMFDLPDGGAMELFAKYGGSNNAFTNYTMTAYYVECTDCFEENLTTLLRMVTTPYFTQETVEKERGIIAQEIRMYEDSADSACFENLFAAMYQNHPARIPICGSVESIGEITPEILYACHRAFYDPGNMVLCVIGDVDAARVIELAKAHTPEGSGSRAVRDYGAAEPDTIPVREVRRRMEVSMPSFVIGFKCKPAKPGEEERMGLIGDLAAELLIGESSQLYQRLYEEGVIDPDFSAGFEHLKGLALFEAAGDSETPERVLEEMLAQAQRIVREGVDRAQFERLKKSMLGRRMRDLDSFEGVCYSMCACCFEQLEYLDYPEMFRTVSPEDVEQFLRENVIKERAAMSVIEPMETEGGTEDVSD
mgnify:CR=1 FL=1